MKSGDRVKYTPSHGGEGEWGTVSSWNDHFVFVKYDKQVSKFGWDGTTSQSTKREDLEFENGLPCKEN